MRQRVAQLARREVGDLHRARQREHVRVGGGRPAHAAAPPGLAASGGDVPPLPTCGKPAAPTVSEIAAKAAEGMRAVQATLGFPGKHPWPNPRPDAPAEVREAPGRGRVETVCPFDVAALRDARVAEASKKQS